MSYRSLAELTLAHPEWRKADTMPADLMTVEMVMVYTQRGKNVVCEAMSSGQLQSTQTCKGARRYTLLPDVQRWVLGLPPRQRPRHRAEAS